MSVIKKLRRYPRRFLLLACVTVLTLFFLIAENSTYRIGLVGNLNFSDVDLNLFQQKHPPSKPGSSGIINKETQLKACKDALLESLDVNVTDKTIKNLLTLCTETDYTDRNDLSRNDFEKLFADDIFNHVTCEEPAIGPPIRQQPMVALASYRGAGSSWVRYLTEKLTGVQTGSLYNKKTAIPFPGDDKCPTNDVMFVVKTEGFGASVGRVYKPQCRRAGLRDVTFEKAVFILRNPFNTFVASYNHNLDQTTDNVLLKPQWHGAVHQKTEQWKYHVSWWLSSYKHPVHVIVYENLVRSPMWEMYNVIKFLEYPVTLRSLVCLRFYLVSPYYREPEFWMVHNNLFMPKTTSYIVDAVKLLTPLFDKYGISRDLVQSYYRFDEIK